MVDEDANGHLELWPPLHFMSCEMGALVAVSISGHPVCNTQLFQATDGGLLCGILGGVGLQES